ncbi:MAG TPA: hypothetical protein VMO26_17600 [Vicinamibacterales bacterium]|nr:hypothetical protein [Vicinamibacterales bacterium]
MTTNMLTPGSQSFLRLRFRARGVFFALLMVAAATRPAAAQYGAWPPGPRGGTQQALAIALQCSERGDWGCATGVLIQAVEMQPNDDQLWLALGLVMATAGRMPEAVACIQQAVGLNPALARHPAVAQLLQVVGGPQFYGGGGYSLGGAGGPGGGLSGGYGSRDEARAAQMERDRRREEDMRQYRECMATARREAAQMTGLTSKMNMFALCK